MSTLNCFYTSSTHLHGRDIPNFHSRQAIHMSRNIKNLTHMKTGSLVILWQTFVTLGLLLGAAANLIFHSYWRVQLGGAFIPALIFLTFVPLCYE